MSSQYIELNPPIGVTTTQQESDRFMITTAMRFAINQNSQFMQTEDAVYWYETAVKGGAVFL